MNIKATKSVNSTGIEYLKKIIKFAYDEKFNGCIEVSNNIVEYFIYIKNGDLIYATNSIEPLERIERHIQRLSRVNRTIEVIKIREYIARVLSKINNSYGEKSNCLDYEIIKDLYDHEYLTAEETKRLVRRCSREVIESFLFLSDVTYSNVVVNNDEIVAFFKCSLSSFINQCHQRIQAWKVLTPTIQSTYQRLYFFAGSAKRLHIGSAENELIYRFLTGFNFRQLSAFLNKDELLVARILYPSIENKLILLKEPNSSFTCLPSITENVVDFLDNLESLSPLINRKPINNSGKYQLPKTDVDIDYSSKIKQWKIVCVDDSPTIRQQIHHFLNADMFIVSEIANPLEALGKLMDIKPDLILLESNMPNLNGYELCSLIRNYPQFEKIPIIITGSDRGLVNRTKGKLAGANSYITKPFSRGELLHMVFRHLN